jgi:CDP-diacylglycerol--glycerol-3-phosphate 3-phosphatidyltransferase
VANLITLSRIFLLFMVILMAYQPPSWWQFLDVPLLIIVFVSDALDGYVARKRNETSLFGAMFDIASDRIVEMSMWVVLAHLGLAPVWAPLVFIVRGSIVDAIRAGEGATHGKRPFDIMEHPLARWLVAGRFMRAFYAVVKAHAFCWLLLIQPMPSMVPGFWARWSWLMEGIGLALVWSAVILCIARGAPVVVEFAFRERRSGSG